MWEEGIMDKLISSEGIKARASEYCLSGEEFNRFCRIIDEEPVAYDVEGVLERLKELPKSSTWNTNSDNIDRDTAVNIVKSGVKYFEFQEIVDTEDSIEDQYRCNIELDKEIQDILSGKY